MNCRTWLFMGGVVGWGLFSAPGCDGGEGSGASGGGDSTLGDAAQAAPDAAAADAGGLGADSGGSSGSGGPGDSAGSVDSTGADAEVSADIPPRNPAVWQFGGELGYQLSLVVPSGALRRPMDLDFNKNKPEQLWVVNIEDHSMTVAEDYGTPAVTYHRFEDNTLHFKQRVVAISFGDEWTFATCGDSDNSYSGFEDPNYFMGPVLWESTLDNFYEHIEDNPGGPHLDMLHNSPLCTGVAWDSANQFFANNGLLGSVEWYDFREPHPHGGDDHSDGITRRLVQGVFTRIEGVPSHMDFDHDSGWLYLADPGGGRVVRIDTNSGTQAGFLFPNLDAGAEAYTMEGVGWEVLPIDPATELDTPAGLVLHDGVLFVSDWATGVIHAFDPDTGDALGALDTGGGAEAVGGLAVGPLDDFLYYVDASANVVVRIEPK